MFDNVENEEDLFDDALFWNVPDGGYPAIESAHEAHEELKDISK